jgi:hypothetical protein
MHEQNLPIALFTSEDGETRLHLRLQEGMLWLTQRQIADLYEKSTKTVNEHLVNIYNEGELEETSTIRKFRIVAREGTRDVERLLDHYNLDTVLAVGYRVRSNRGTQFRQWATQILKEYLVKGFAMDDERLKNPGRDFGEDYFDALLERIRDIRTSERRFYQKITDIYTTASDYNSGVLLTQEFFAAVQNKLHWAIHGHTAAELIYKRANSRETNMGLSNWDGSRIRKRDVSVAKNYLSKEELQSLNRIVTMYLDYAEDQASKHRSMSMQQWADKLDSFLEFNEQCILQDAGKISANVAKKLAEEEYDKYVIQRRIDNDKIDSDFDKLINTVKTLPNDKDS